MYKYPIPLQLYTAGINNILVQLKALNGNFYQTHDKNLFHHVVYRIKSPDSIFAKMNKYGIDPSLESAIYSIYDIAGIRVVFNYHKDIYNAEALFLERKNVHLINRKDYIANPKESGYRSLHLIVKTPVAFAGRIYEIPVEMQLRTNLMDYWANLEHTLQYKNKENNHKHSSALLDYANELDDSEREREHLHERFGA